MQLNGKQYVLSLWRRGFGRGIMVGMEPNRRHYRAERAGMIAFLTAASAAIVVHPVASGLMAWNIIDKQILGPALLIFDLPSLPLYVVLIYPLKLPAPLPFICQALLSGFMWGVIASIPTYFVVRRKRGLTTNN